MAHDNPSPETRFKPGNPGGRGRQKEARDRISRAFLYAFADDFEANGVQAIADLREQDVASYVKVAVALQPKEVEHRHGFEGMDLAQLDAAIEALKAALRAKVDADQPAVTH